MAARVALVESDNMAARIIFLRRFIETKLHYSCINKYEDIIEKQATR